MWGATLDSEQDVWDVFYYYLSGGNNSRGVKVTKIPWNDEELSAETSPLTDTLAQLNKKGVLTINSQPNVNGLTSSDPTHGWGQPGGYIYKKAYVEFFTCATNVKKLKKTLVKYPQVNYHIINKNGKFNYTNAYRQCPIAVTWGVFPGREIIQPTVVDPESFLVWKDEAFALWKEQWGKLYSEDSKSRQIIDSVADSYYLVNLVDNDYPKETVLWKILNEMLETEDQNQNEEESEPEDNSSNWLQAEEQFCS